MDECIHVLPNWYLCVLLGKRKAARSASLRHTKKDATFAVPGTLPRKKQQDSLGDINQSKKLTWFFLGQGKKK